MRHRAGPIAIDFGSYALRVMQIGARERRNKVLAAACHVCPSRESGGAPGRSTTIHALRSMLQGNRFVGRQVVSALNAPELVVKNIRVPEMPETELASAVRFEAVQRIPNLNDDAEIRFIRAGTVPGSVRGAPGQQEVIVLAARADAINQHLALLSELGLESVGIDAVPCAVFRPFERYLRRSEDREQVNVFVDIGWAGTRITLTRGDRIAFTKSFAVGGAKLDELVAKDLSLDLTKARELRQQIAAWRCDQHAPSFLVTPANVEAVDAAVRAGLDQLGKEIGLCLRYYAVTFRPPVAERPDAVTCVGGEALDAHHLEELSEVTGLPCRVGFPLRSLDCPGEVEFANGDSRRVANGPMADWTTVAGLSMRWTQPRHAELESVGR